jgi:hypothetical protein
MPFEELGSLPEYFTDSVNFMTNIYGITMEFGVMQPNDQPPIPKARVKMSPQHAKIMSLLLRKNVQAYERRIGTIILPDQLYRDLGIVDDMVGE